MGPGSPPLSREQRLAREISKRLGLVPPVPIEVVLRKFADIEEDNLPGNVDAVIIHPSSTRKRPLVILDLSKPGARRRFTLAHELAHIVIPWHIGTIACHTNWNMEFGEALYLDTESEANRFAAELLMPKEWVDEVAARPATSFLSKVKAIRNGAEVSYSAAMLSLVRSLRLGHLGAVVDQSGRVMIATASSGTAIAPPERGAPLPEFPKALHESIVEDNYAVHCWTFVTAEEPIVSEDARTASEILSDMLLDLFDGNEDNVKKNRAILNGVIGAAKSEHHFHTQPLSEFISLLRHKIADNPRYSYLSKHPDFNLFLTRKASEISENK